MPPNNNPSFDFILNNQPQGAKSFIPGTGSSKKQRILVAIVGLVLLLLVGFIVYTFVFARESGQTDKLIDIVARQNEIIRISDLADDKVKSQETKALAATAKLSLTSSQRDFKDLIKKQGRKINPEEITHYKDTNTDKQLATAAQSNRYDETYLQILANALDDYQKTIKTTYDASTSKSERALLEKTFNQASLLAN